MVGLSKAGRPLPRTAPVWQILAVTAVALATANCAGQPQKLAAGGTGSTLDPKYGVKASPRLYGEGDVIPKGGGRRFSGKPYVVAGRTYVPRAEAGGYVREGLASWYGSAFHGRMTANGEVFDRHSIAAAHPTLPLPSYVRVTNLANGNSMIVRVNDRGPYHANRLMDVSEEVAQALEFRQRGTAKVRVEYVGKASTAGSDDAKLMATLRTDGQPASIRGRGPVMLADLGTGVSDAPAETLSRPARPALAFKPPAEEAEELSPRATRPAPTLVASAATVAVPRAVQPTTTRQAAFRPEPAAFAPSARAGGNERREAPLSLSPPPLRLAGLRHAAPAEEIPRARARPAPERLAALGPATTRSTTTIAKSVPPASGTATRGVPSPVQAAATRGGTVPAALRAPASRIATAPDRPVLVAATRPVSVGVKPIAASPPAPTGPRTLVAAARIATPSTFSPSAKPVQPAKPVQSAKSVQLAKSVPLTKPMPLTKVAAAPRRAQFAGVD